MSLTISTVLLFVVRQNSSHLKYFRINTVVSQGIPFLDNVFTHDIPKISLFEV